MHTPLICGQHRSATMSHHTIRDHSTPSLTPASDSANRVIARGQAAMADKLRLPGAEGAKVRICMAMQNALVQALSAEIDAGNTNKMALLEAVETAVGCNIAQAIGSIMGGAPPEVRSAALMMVAGNATSFAAAQLNKSTSDVSIAHEMVTITRAGAA
jgi:type III secretion system FlhB-like substrate exporter